MTATATTDYQDLTTLDPGAVQTGSLGPYEEAQTFSPITPGRYDLQLPVQILGKPINVGGTTALEFSLEGLKIAEGEFTGRNIFNQRVSTLPIKAKGKTINATDAWDLLRNLGLAGDTEPSAAEYISGMQNAQGLVARNVEVGVQGSYEGAEPINIDPKLFKRNARGYVTIYQKAFFSGGVFQPEISVTSNDGTTRTVKAKPAVAWRGWSARS